MILENNMKNENAPWNVEDLKDSDRNEGEPKNENDTKEEDNLRNKDYFKSWDDP